ncbi:hypothetical protein Trydic_g7015 [Trypoxylus dichotomus]
MRKPLYHTEIRLPLTLHLCASTIPNCDPKDQFCGTRLLYIDGYPFLFSQNAIRFYVPLYHSEAILGGTLRSRTKKKKAPRSDGPDDPPIHNNISPGTCVIIVGTRPQLVEILLKWIFLSVGFRTLFERRRTRFFLSLSFLSRETGSGSF